MTQKEIVSLSNEDLLTEFVRQAYQLGVLDAQLEYCGGFAAQMAAFFGRDDALNDLGALEDEVIRRMGGND